MATNKDTENNSPSAPAPADNDISMLTKVTKQDLAEAIVDEYGAKYSKDGKKLLEIPISEWHYDASIRHYAIKGHYVIKEGTEIIGDHAFSSCKSLASITIPPSVTAIGDSAFYGCSSLTSITIPPSVNTIGKQAFFECNSLTSITISPGVNTIGDCAFNNKNYISQLMNKDWSKVNNNIK